MGSIIFIRTQNVGKNGLNLNDVRYITHEFHNSLKKSQLKAGDVLISRVVTDEMRCGIVPSEFEPANCANIILLRPGPDLDSQFLRYLINSSYAQQYLMDRRVGSAQQVVNTKVLKDWVIPFPSLEEQKRIVAILDEAFAGIDTAIANTEKNLANARELFESYLNSVFSQRGDGWEDKKLEEITSKLGDGLHGTPKYTPDGEYHFINGNNLNDGVIEFKERTKKVSFEEFEKYKKELNERTVLVSINGTLGNVAFYNNEKVILGKSACYFNLINGVEKAFVKYVIQSPYFLSYAHREATGATIKNVSLKSMRKFKVPLPSVEKQKELVVLLDGLSAETRRLESIYQQKLNSLAELKQSLLQKAFSGELTAKPDTLINEAVA